jgi:predicted amidophosphoribosyltransferase
MRQRDPELQYCPKCDEEYRTEIRVCADCGVELISGRDLIAAESTRKEKKVTRSMELTVDDDLVNIRKGTLREMKKLQEVLVKEHIPSLIAGEKSSNCGKGCCGTELFLQIKKEDGAAAMEVLGKEFKRTTALDHHDLSHVQSVYDTGAGQTVCQACGFRFSTKNTTCPDCGLCFG